MKVAILADFPLHVIPEFGEAFRPAGHYATWLPQVAGSFESFAGLEAHWVILSNRLSALKETFWKKQSFHVLPTSNKHRASTFFYRDRKQIRTLLDRIRPDVVHGWGTEDVYALAAATAPYPNVISMQGILSHIALKCRRHPREYFQAFLELYVIRRACRITVESQWGRERLARRNPCANISVVEYGVQPHFFEPAWLPNPNTPSVIFVGSLTPLKGIQDLVEAFQSPKLAGAELWVVGGGSGKWVENLRRRASSNVRWFGRQSSQEIASLLGRAWCLALPTRADTCPNVVKEARVVGLPVITTPCGGQISYIEDGQNGFLVKPGDIRQLTDRLVELLGDLDATRRVGGFRHAEQRVWFRPENTASGLFNIYRELAGA